MEEAHEPIIPIEVFEQLQEEMKRRSNIEVVNGEKKEKIHIIVQRMQKEGMNN